MPGRTGSLSATWVNSIRAEQPQPANPSIVTIITVLAFLAEPQIALLEMARVLKLGSQSPRISRNAMTFAGLIIWETVSPGPNSRPDARAASMAGIGSGPHQVPENDVRNDRCPREDNRCDDRALRKPCQAADAVTARETAAQTCSEPDQKSSGDDHQQGEVTSIFGSAPRANP